MSVTITDGIATFSGSGELINCTMYLDHNVYAVVINNYTSIGNYAFKLSTDITTITISNSVTHIGDYAFYKMSSLTTVNLPNSVTHIGDYAFYGTVKLTTISIPINVSSIGYETFGSTPLLTEILVDSGNSNYLSQDGILFNKTQTQLLHYPVAKLDTEYTIPSSVTIISDNAFKLATRLTSVTLSNGVTHIDDSAFSWMSNLSTINIPTTVTHIGENVYYKTDLVETLTIPSSVTHIGNLRFGGTTINVVGGNTVYSSQNGVLFDKQKTRLILYPPQKTTVNYTIPTSVESIEPYAFRNAIHLEEVHIPESVLSVGDSIFLEANNLKRITVHVNNAIYSSTPEGVLFNKDKTILIQYPPNGPYTEYTIPDTVAVIRDNAFRNATKLTFHIIPSAVHTIGAFAFYNNTSATSINISDSTTNIGNASFYNLAPSAIVYVNALTYTSYYNFINDHTLKFHTATGNVSFLPRVIVGLDNTSVDENETFVSNMDILNNSGETITFTLAGPDADAFELDGSKIVSKQTFDYENKRAYEIILVASYGNFNTTAKFSIVVKNVLDSAIDAYNENIQGSPLKEYNFQVTELISAGYSQQQLLDAGYTRKQLENAGLSVICFPAGTPISCDQGVISINSINVKRHTIRGKKIVAITRTITEEKHLVCIQKDAFSKNVPCQDTITSTNHSFFYKGRMNKAKDLVNMIDNVRFVEYDGCILYNVLLEKHDKMVVNNLISETLHPENRIAKIFNYFSQRNFSIDEENELLRYANKLYADENELFMSNQKKKRYLNSKNKRHK
mgnify:CR=1 FL=1|jgi:hypothetical protein